MAGAEMLYEAKAIYETNDNLIDKEQILNHPGGKFLAV